MPCSLQISQPSAFHREAASAGGEHREDAPPLYGPVSDSLLLSTCKHRQQFSLPPQNRFEEEDCRVVPLLVWSEQESGRRPAQEGQREASLCL